MHNWVIASAGNVALIVIVAIISVGAVVARIKLSINLTAKRVRPDERAAAVVRLWWLWLPLGLIAAALGLTEGTSLLDPTNPFTLGLVLLVLGVGGARVAVRRRG